MHAFAVEDVDGPGQGGRHRRHEDREAAILELFDDEGRDESLLDLGECRLPEIVPPITSQSLREASKQYVTRRSARPLGVRTAAPTRKPQGQHEEKRQNIFGW
jgi:hypothetical protein